MSELKELQSQAAAARAAGKRLAQLSTAVKNKALEAIAAALIANQETILAANRKDYETGKASGLTEALLDRLFLDKKRIEGIAHDVRIVAALPDPVGEFFDMRTLPNGLIIGRKRVPLGVIATVYESRPNVTVDISALCIKSGNAAILRGGKEAFHSSAALAALVQEAAYKNGIPEGAIQFIENTDRALVLELLKMNQYIDLIVPRGGAGLINFVKENATVPVVAGGIGVCHTFIDRSADIKKTVPVIYNAKVQRPTVCNALDCILVHAQCAPAVLPPLAAELAKAGVEFRCDQKALAILGPQKGLKLVAAKEEDWGKEFLALVLAVKIVNSLDEALEHIDRYGSGHSEAIITEDHSHAMRFLSEADASAILVNASTRFNDGGQLGLGAEVGISTQKMHARGPMGLKEITSYKWVVFGNGQVRA